MAFYKQDIVDVNLETGVIHRSFLNHTIGHKDDDADRFGIRAFRNGEPVDLSGAQCQAVFMAPDGTNIALTSYGTVSGNEAYVTLPQACYNVEGQFCLAIKLVGGGVTATVRIIDGVVDRTGATGAVAPTEAVPTYQEILAVYAQMQEDVADYESVVATQNGKIDDLKSALEEDIFGTICVPYNPTFSVIEGGVNPSTGANTTSSSRARTQYIDVNPNTLYIFRLINDDFVTINGTLYTRAEGAGYTRRVTLENDRCLIFKTSDTETKLRVSFAHNDLTTTVSQSDRATIKDSIKIFTYTDTTLTKSGSPADAKATGDMGAEMGDYIDKLVDVVSKDNSVRVDWSELYSTNNHPLGWIGGYFNSSDGSPSTSTKWIRTINRAVDFSAAIGFVIEPPTGYSVVVCEYDQ
ncbi:MAG: hypothetical protein J6S83_03080, partial [Lachnospiraceae bacterium]|nr:hypothetical protein [Lachnospiraceae bacterium]